MGYNSVTDNTGLSPFV